MNADIHLEHRASSSQGKHEGEPSLGLCDRLNRTRDNSQRQLPTDHDYAVPTREYQTDQSSLKTAPTAARSVFGKGKQRQRQKQPHCCAELTRSLHIRPMRSSSHSAYPSEVSSTRELAPSWAKFRKTFPIALLQWRSPCYNRRTPPSHLKLLSPYHKIPDPRFPFRKSRGKVFRPAPGPAALRSPQTRSSPGWTPQKSSE
jgi:hypothetical protein